MSQDPFGLQLESAHKRLAALSQQGQDLPREHREVIDDVLHQLATALEELQVTGEELRQQNEELLALQGQLERERRRYQELFEFAPGGYLVTDPDGVILHANQAAGHLLNLHPDYLTGKLLISYVAPPQRETFYAQLKRAVGDGAPATGGAEWELQLLRERRNPFPSALTVAPERNAEGQVVGLRWLLRDISASRRAEERERLLAEVALERARLEAVIQNAPEGIVVADREARILLTNPSADAIYSRPVPYGEDYDRHADMGLRHPDGTPYDPRDLPLTRSALDGETLADQELIIVWPDGQQRHLLVNSAPIHDTVGEVIGAVAVFQDISERKRVRRALRRYAQRLEALHRIDAAILAASSVEEIADAALPGVRQLLPCPWAGLSLFAAGPVAGEDEVLRLDANGLAEVVPLAQYGSLQDLRQGQIRLAEEVQPGTGIAPLGGLPSAEDLLAQGAHSFLSLPLIADGNLIGTLDLALSTAGPPDEEHLEIAREMADQLAIGLRQALLRNEVEHYTRGLERSVARRTAALQASEARFRTIFEDAALGIALVDHQGRILDSNPALQELLGYSAQEMEGRTFLEFTHPDDVRDSHELYQELFAGKLREYQIEKRYLRKDGAVVWVRPTVSLIRTLGDGGQYALKMVENITEQKRSQEALIQAERITIAGQLGASLAHEINNPLQAVVGCLGLAEESLAEGQDVERYLTVAREELQRAARIVARLRDLHRRSEPGEKEPTDLVALMEEVLLLLEKQFKSRKIQVIWNLPEWLPHFSLVPDRIRQVFLNLALNAADAMPGGGQLRIEARLVEGTDGAPAGVNVSFVDDGLGINGEGKKRLFEPFFTTKPEGLGLGLYISRRIVADHDGKIRVESQPGEGTCVNVWLPFREQDDRDSGR